MKAVLKNLIFSVALSLVAFLSPASQSWAQPAPAPNPFLLRSGLTDPYIVLDEQVWDSTLQAWRPFDSLSPFEQKLDYARRLKAMDPVEGYQRYLERAFWESYPTIGSAAGKKYYASYDKWKSAPENNPQMTRLEFALARGMLPSSHGGAPGNINDTLGTVAAFGPGLPPGVSRPPPLTRARQTSTLPSHQGDVFQAADLLDASGRVLSACSYWRPPSRMSAPHSIGQSDRLALPSPPRLLALPSKVMPKELLEAGLGHLYPTVSALPCCYQYVPAKDAFELAHVLDAITNIPDPHETNDGKVIGGSNKGQPVKLKGYFEVMYGPVRGRLKLAPTLASITGSNKGDWYLIKYVKLYDINGTLLDYHFAYNRVTGEVVLHYFKEYE